MALTFTRLRWLNAAAGLLQLLTGAPLAPTETMAPAAHAPHARPVLVPRTPSHAMHACPPLQALRYQYQCIEMSRNCIETFRIAPPAGLAILGISEKGGKASLPWYTFFIGSWSRNTPEKAAEFYR